MSNNWHNNFLTTGTRTFRKSTQKLARNGHRPNPYGRAQRSRIVDDLSKYNEEWYSNYVYVKEIDSETTALQTLKEFEVNDRIFERDFGTVTFKKS